MIFFTMNPNLKYFFFWGGRGYGWGLGGRLDKVNFFYKESKSKKKYFFLGGRGGGSVGGMGGGGGAGISEIIFLL